MLVASLLCFAVSLAASLPLDDGKDQSFAPSGMRLIFAHVLWRHGARSPNAMYPNSLNKIDDFAQEEGELVHVSCPSSLVLLICVHLCRRACWSTLTLVCAFVNASLNVINWSHHATALKKFTSGVQDSTARLLPRCPTSLGFTLLTTSKVRTTRMPLFGPHFTHRSLFLRSIGTTRTFSTSSNATALFN